jgi:hypothetical protein
VMMRIVLIFLLLCTPALAHDPSHPELNEWFNRLASGKGLCCSFADGFIFDSYDMSPVLFGKGKSKRDNWFYFTEKRRLCS